MRTRNGWYCFPWVWFFVWVEKPIDPRKSSTTIGERYFLLFQFQYSLLLLFLFTHVPSPFIRTGFEGPGLTAPQKIWFCLASVGGQYIGMYKAASFLSFLSYLYAWTCSSCLHIYPEKSYIPASKRLTTIELWWNASKIKLYWFLIAKTLTLHVAFEFTM